MAHGRSESVLGHLYGLHVSLQTLYSLGLQDSVARTKSLLFILAVSPYLQRRIIYDRVAQSQVDSYRNLLWRGTNRAVEGIKISIIDLEEMNQHIVYAL